MRPTFKIQSLVLLLAAFLLLHACAKQGYPTGGPKDETPPVVLGTTPANGTLNFDAKEFSIAFDEYVQVKDADNNILVSPPMNPVVPASTSMSVFTCFTFRLKVCSFTSLIFLAPSVIAYICVSSYILS